MTLKSKFFFVCSTYCSLPEDALDLLDQMLTLDPSKRASCEEALNHAFLKDVNPDEIEPPS